MKIICTIEENTRGLDYQPWPWNIVLRYEPTRRMTTTYAHSLTEAFQKLEKLVKEDI